MSHEANQLSMSPLIQELDKMPPEAGIEQNQMAHTEQTLHHSVTYREITNENYHQLTSVPTQLDNFNFLRESQKVTSYLPEQQGHLQSCDFQHGHVQSCDSQQGHLQSCVSEHPQEYYLYSPRLSQEQVHLAVVSYETMYLYNFR